MQSSEPQQLANWAGNVAYGTQTIFYPTNTDEIKQLVSRLDHVKVLGTRHSFNNLADSHDALILLDRFTPHMEIDESAQTVTVSANIRYGQLCDYLESHGYALHNLGSLPHISVAGACVAATHGSGVNNALLAQKVCAIEIVDAFGSLRTLSRKTHADIFSGCVVNLGALGVVTSLTLEIEPSYTMRQTVYEHLSLASLKNDFADIMSAGYSVSLFTDWHHASFNQVWIKERIHEETASDTPTDFYGAKRATKNLHPIKRMSAKNCTNK